MSNLVPDGWEERTLNNCLELLTDFEANGSFATVKENVTVYDNENHAWYVRATDLEKKSQLSDVKFVDEHSFNFLKKTKLDGNEVLITKRGEIGKVYYFKPVNKPSTLAPNLYLLKLNNSVDSKFIYYSFASDEGKKKLIRINASTTMGALYKNDVKSLPLTVPPLPEQQKIAKILTSVDEVIEKTQAQIDKLKDLKIGMMQELLTNGIGHTEFKDSPVGRIPAEWEVKELNKLVSIKHGYAFEGQYFSTTPSKYILLTPGNFNRDGRLYFGVKTKYYTGDIPEGYILKNGDVLVVMTDLTKEMTILGNTITLQSPQTVLHNQRIGKVEIVAENSLTHEYLCFVMNSDRVKTHVKDTATGTTVRHSSPTKILEPFIPVPPVEEQRKITSIFDSINSKLSRVENKLQKLRSTKKALMQDLLTGKGRVKVDS